MSKYTDEQYDAAGFGPIAERVFDADCTAGVVNVREPTAEELELWHAEREQAAEKLKAWAKAVTEAEQRRAVIAAKLEELGITPAELREALGLPPA